MQGDLVCVTGAGGFVGSHVVRELLERGYRVRGTVRDPKDTSKIGHLLRLPGADERLEFVAADLLDASAFASAFADCSYVAHVAASVQLTAKDPQRDIVDPAVTGMANVFDALVATKSVRRVVVTSSVAAVASLKTPVSHVFTEADWMEDATLEESAYELAKTLSERLLWKRYEALDPATRFGLVAINPGFVIGPIMAPVHLRSSPTIFRDMLRRSYPAWPNFAFGTVDVRDVARAHVEALERKEAEGRYILVRETMALVDAARILAAHHPERRIPTRRLPNFVMWMVAPFDKRVNFSTLRNQLGKARRFDGSRATRELGIEYRPLERSVVETAAAILELGLA